MISTILLAIAAVIFGLLAFDVLPAADVWQWAFAASSAFVLAHVSWPR